MPAVFHTMHAHIRAILIVLLSSEVIKTNIGIVHSEGVQEIQYRFSHHRRTAEAERRPAYREERPPPRRAYSVMLLEVGVARISRARSRSLPRVAGAQPTPRMAHPAHTARTHEIGLGLVARRIKIGL